MGNADAPIAPLPPLPPAYGHGPWHRDPKKEQNYELCVRIRVTSIKCWGNFNCSFLFEFMCSGINRHWRTMMPPAVQISNYPKRSLSILRKTCCMLKRTDCIDRAWRSVLWGFRRYLLPSKVSIVTSPCFQISVHTSRWLHRNFETKLAPGLYRIM